MKIAGSLAALAIGITLVLPQSAEAATSAACTWRANTLPIPTGATRVGVYTTDHNGGWAGAASFGTNNFHVVAWKNGTITDYGQIGNSATVTVSILDENRAGTVIGYTRQGFTGQIAPGFRIRAGQLEQLPVLLGGFSPMPAAINDSGDIYGTNSVQRNGEWGSVVVRWPGDRPTAVEEVPGLPFKAKVVDADEDGTLLVSPSGAIFEATHVFRAGQLTALPRPPPYEFLNAKKISNGRVTGYAARGSDPSVGVVWERDLTPHILPNAQSGQYINRDGLILGYSPDATLIWGVWRNRTLEFAFGAAHDDAFVGTVSDDGTFGGSFRGNPTFWRCS